MSVAVFSNRATAVHVNAPSLGACNNSVFSTLTSWYALPHAHLDAVYTASASGVTHRPGQVNRSLYSPTLIVSPAAAYAVVPTDGACLPSPRPSGSPTHGTGTLLQPLCRPRRTPQSVRQQGTSSREKGGSDSTQQNRHPPDNLSSHLIICPWGSRVCPWTRGSAPGGRGFEEEEEYKTCQKPGDILFSRYS